MMMGISSCSNDQPTFDAPEVSINNLSGEYEMPQSDEIRLKAVIKSSSKSTFKWYVGGVAQATTDSVFVFTTDRIGEHVVSLKCINEGGEKEATAQISVYGKYRHGTFILNEGNMTSENGTLIFISPKGQITDSVYIKTNNKTLGNVTQDLFIKNGKMYIISQNGKKNTPNMESEGMLVVANAETLKHLATYDEELKKTLSWPTHIAVVNDNNLFIRDNKGVYAFDPATKKLTFVKGSEGALKNRMAVVGNKVFVPGKKQILVLEAGKTEVTQTIELNATISGVIKSADNNVWVSVLKTSDKKDRIIKIKAADGTIIKENEISEGSVNAGWGATPGITAIGNTIYFSGTTTSIYRHNFETGDTKLMVDASTLVQDANIVYNNIAVNPKTGHVYINTLKGFGLDFLKNSIALLDFSGTAPKLHKEYRDYTNFPAGIFFTYDFN